MSDFIVHPICDVDPKPFDTRQAAQNAKDEHCSLCEKCDKQKVEITVDENGTERDSQDSEAVDVEPVDSPKEVVETAESDTTAGYDLPDKPPVDEDPLVWMPDEFTDIIDGTIAINRKGFEVLAHHYDITCLTDMVVNPVDSHYTVCVVKAIATDANDNEYTAYGEAHESEVDVEQMVRMADTRAYKRAVSRATGVGTVAVSELQSSLEQ